MKWRYPEVTSIPFVPLSIVVVGLGLYPAPPFSGDLSGHPSIVDWAPLFLSLEQVSLGLI